MTELSLQEYYEIVQREGLLFKSLGDDAMAFDSYGSTPDPELDCTKLMISTADEDRFADILNPLGCSLEHFKLNPLFLFEHGMRAPMSESILGRISQVTIDATCITAVARYVPLNSNPLPGQIWEMEKKGLIPGNSIGWRPLGGITSKNGKRYVDKWELLEVSKVLLPVNGKATNRQLSN